MRFVATNEHDKSLARTGPYYSKKSFINRYFLSKKSILLIFIFPRMKTYIFSYSWRLVIETRCERKHSPLASDDRSELHNETTTRFLGETLNRQAETDEEVHNNYPEASDDENIPSSEALFGQAGEGAFNFDALFDDVSNADNIPWSSKAYYNPTLCFYSGSCQ